MVQQFLQLLPRLFLSNSSMDQSKKIASAQEQQQAAVPADWCVLFWLQCFAFAIIFILYDVIVSPTSVVPVLRSFSLCISPSFRLSRPYPSSLSPPRVSVHIPYYCIHRAHSCIVRPALLSFLSVSSSQHHRTRAFISARGVFFYLVSFRCVQGSWPTTAAARPRTRTAHRGWMSSSTTHSVLNTSFASCLYISLYSSFSFFLVHSF